MKIHPGITQSTRPPDETIFGRNGLNSQIGVHRASGSGKEHLLNQNFRFHFPGDQLIISCGRLQ